MADAGALKAPGAHAPCGFESRPRHRVRSLAELHPSSEGLNRLDSTRYASYTYKRYWVIDDHCLRTRGDAS